MSALLLFLPRASHPLTVFAWFEEQSAGGRPLSRPGDCCDPHLVPLVVVQVLQGPHQALLRRTLKPTLQTNTMAVKIRKLKFISLRKMPAGMEVRAVTSQFTPIERKCLRIKQLSTHAILGTILFIYDLPDT